MSLRSVPRDVGHTKELAGAWVSSRLGSGETAAASSASLGIELQKRRTEEGCQQPQPDGAVGVVVRSVRLALVVPEHLHACNDTVRRRSV